MPLAFTATNSGQHSWYCQRIQSQPSSCLSFGEYQHSENFGSFIMTYITEYASITSIPKNILRYLNREGLIQDPLSQEDILCLRFLEHVWGNKKILRAQLSRLSVKARQSFLRTADLPTKWERYAFSRFYNLEPGKKLPMGTIIEEIQTTFCFLCLC